MLVVVVVMICFDIVLCCFYFFLFLLLVAVVLVVFVALEVIDVRLIVACSRDDRPFSQANRFMYERWGSTVASLKRKSTTIVASTASCPERTVASEPRRRKCPI